MKAASAFCSGRRRSALAIAASARLVGGAKPVYGDWGYDAAAMDRSVKPGDDFFDYVNGSWFKRTADRRRPDLRRDQFRPQRPDRRATSAPSSRTWPRTRASGRIGQQVGDFYASWMDEAGDRGARHRAAEALSRQDRRGERPRRPGRSVRRAGLPVADRTRHLSPISSDPTRYSACRRPGRPRHAQPRLLSAAGREVRRLSRRPIATISSTIEKLAGIPDAEARADRIIALETEHRQGALDAGAKPRRRGDLQSDDPRPARQARAAIRMGPALAKLGARLRPRSSSPSRARSRPPASCSPACRFRRGRII